MPNPVEMLETLVNVTLMGNKWSMWIEQNFPEQATYLQPVFQLRDSQSHLVKMFAFGFKNCQLDPNGESDFKEFFNSSDTLFQIQEALGHVFRAFFDCADFIIIRTNDIILNEIEDNNRKFVYKQRIQRFIGEIAELRSEKSESHANSFKNVEKWDAILSNITAIYNYSEYYELAPLLQNLEQLEDTIEKNHSKETILAHCADFYSRIKKEIADLGEQNSWYDKIVTRIIDADDGSGNPSADQAEIKKDLENQQKKINALTGELVTLDKMMKNTTKLQKFQLLHKQLVSPFNLLFSIVATVGIDFVYENIFFTAGAVPASANTAPVHNPLFNSIMAVFGLFCAVWFATCIIKALYYKSKYK